MRYLLSLILITLLLNFSAIPSEAGLLSLLSKAVKVSVKGGSKVVSSGGARVAIRSLTKAEALALAAGTAVYVDVNGANLIFHTISTGAEKIADIASDFSKIANKVVKQVTTRTSISRSFVMTRENAIKLGERIEELARVGEVHIVADGLGRLPLRIIKLPSGMLGKFVEIRPGLVSKLDEPLSTQTMELLSKGVKREDIVVVSAFHRSHADTIKRIADAAGDKLIDGEELFDSSGKISFSKLKGSVAIITGHIENGAFLAEVSGKTGEAAYRISIKELEEAAAESGVTVLSVGCNSLSHGARAGYITTITDVEVAQSIKNALVASNYSEWLAAFGRKGSPFVVSEESLQRLVDGHIIDLSRLYQHKGKVNGAVTSLRLSSAFTKSESVQEAATLVERAYDFSIGSFGVGMLPFVLLFRVNRRTFLRLFPLIPSSKFQPYKSILLKFCREIVFLIVGIPLSALVLLLIFFGAWTKREEAYLFLWSAFLTPITFATNLISYAKIAVSNLVYLALGLVWTIGNIFAFLLPLIILLLEIWNIWPSLSKIYITSIFFMAIIFSYLGWWSYSKCPDIFLPWLAKAKLPDAVFPVVTLVCAVTFVSIIFVFNTVLSGILLQIATIPFKEIDLTVALRSVVL